MNQKKYYLLDKKNIAFYQQKADAEFWDKHWENHQIEAMIRSTTNDGLFIPLVQKYLPKESVVLEGGCGRGQLVYALQYQGYKAIGVDYAVQTIKKIKEVVPELDVRVGDVFALDFQDNSLDGYISVGVIEHFWEGYQTIIEEMRRVLRPGGYLFISFPYLSPLRRLKIFLKLYPTAVAEELNQYADSFYQFALSDVRLKTELEEIGFQCKESITFSGLKGFKDEVKLLRPLLQEIYDGKRAKFLWGRLDKLFMPFASHCALLVMQKR